MEKQASENDLIWTFILNMEKYTHKQTMKNSDSFLFIT